MKDFWDSIGPIISAVFGAGGLISLIIAKKERKTATDLNNASTVDIIQKIYKQFVIDTQLEIEQMKQEVTMLRSIVEAYKKTCDACPNNNNDKKNK